jgi:hypothetical protein
VDAGEVGVDEAGHGQTVRRGGRRRTACPQPSLRGRKELNGASASRQSTDDRNHTSDIGECPDGKHVSATLCRQFRRLWYDAGMTVTEEAGQHVGFKYILVYWQRVAKRAFCWTIVHPWVSGGSVIGIPLLSFIGLFLYAQFTSSDHALAQVSPSLYAIAIAICVCIIVALLGILRSAASIDYECYQRIRTQDTDPILNAQLEKLYHLGVEHHVSFLADDDEPTRYHNNIELRSAHDRRDAWVHDLKLWIDETTAFLRRHCQSMDHSKFVRLVGNRRPAYWTGSNIRNLRYKVEKRLLDHLEDILTHRPPIREAD